jgi:hypothetical protein
VNDVCVTVKYVVFCLCHIDKEPMIKLAMTRQENRHSRPGMDLVRDEVSYGVSCHCQTILFIVSFVFHSITFTLLCRFS